MASHRSNSWAKPAIEIAAAGFGAAVAGPLGGALGGWLGAALGGSAAELLKNYADKFGNKAAEKLLELGTDSLVDRLKESSPDLESVYRESLRLSLTEVHRYIGSGFDDWFANWNSCLAASARLNLSSVHPDQFLPTKIDDLFRLTLERLDAQGTALRQGSLSLELNCRVLPAALLSQLKRRLPLLLGDNFRALVLKPEYEQAWKQVQLIFQDYADTALGRMDDTTQRIDRKTDVLPQIAADMAAFRKMAEGFLLFRKPGDFGILGP
jgi:hypothetical protein